MTKIIVLKEKHGDSYLGPYASQDQVEDGAASIIRFRINEGYWYDSDETAHALEAIESKTSCRWLAKRYGEYEGFEIHTIDPIMS